MRILRNGRAGALAGVAVTALALGSLTACGSAGASGGGGGVTLNLVSYSTPQTAFEEIIKAFQETPAGKNVDFKQSYGASGDQSRAVADGQPADVVEFALAPDVTRLVDADIVDPTWDSGQYKGIVTKSVTSIIVRKGNPKDIQGWDDLVKGDVEVLNANPFTSGGARWNVMAAYGAQLQQGKTKQEAEDYLDTLFHHIPVQDESARTALQTFITGKGDALLSYENEAIFAQQSGQDVDYVVPDDTILIENPVAATKTTDHPVEAKAFVDFLYTPTAQKIFSEKGFRPVVPGTSTATFPTPTGLFTIDDLGGWDKVMVDFFDPENSVVANIEQGLGVSTEK